MGEISGAQLNPPRAQTNIQGMTKNFKFIHNPKMSG
jgi:hypothetical protein